MDELSDIAGIIGGFLGTSIVIIMILMWPFSYFSPFGKVAEFKSVQTTLETARQRKDVSPYEIAAIQQKVVEANKWLANVQYWNSIPIAELYIPDVVDGLKPIK